MGKEETGWEGRSGGKMGSGPELLVQGGVSAATRQPLIPDPEGGEPRAGRREVCLAQGGGGRGAGPEDPDTWLF